MAQTNYDYIIVGAGSAGSAIAHRLTSDGRFRVLLLEAGRKSHPWSRIPVGFAKLIKNPAANWCYDSEPESATSNRRIPVPRGKLLGGSSAINGMVFVRGQSQDFDSWAQLGNRGWSYQDVLPIFKSMESYAGGDSEYRGRDGLLKVTDPVEPGPLFDALLKSAEQIGIKRNMDYNGATQDGIGLTQATISNGRRMSTAYCYLEPARSRPNLEIQTGALTETLLIENKVCTGVRYRVGGVMHEARATREVIVSAGAINSPKLLELSGIGQPEKLREFGINVQHALAGVGENLRDHYAPRLRWDISQRGVTYNDMGRGLGLVKEALRYGFSRKGFLSMPAGPIRAYFRTRPGLESPDAGLSFFPFTANPDFTLRKEPGLTGVTHQLRPESQGSIHLNSPDPQQAPAIRFNFLSAELDQQTVIACVRTTRDLMNAPAMDAFRGEEKAPGKSIESDDEILDWVKATAETTYHPVGTCKMGSDDMAVVSDQLKVHGIEHLRVADASIMPTLTSGNTNAPSIMIGEKCARLILAQAN